MPLGRLGPWELDPQQPRIAVDLKTRLRHYGGLGRTEGGVRRLLSEFSFGPAGEHVARCQRRGGC